MDRYYVVVVKHEYKEKDATFYHIQDTLRSNATDKAIEMYRRENNLGFDKLAIAQVIYETSDPERSSLFFEGLNQED